MSEKVMNQIATGNTADVFDYADGKILKLFKSGYLEENIEREFNNSSLVNKLGIPSPKAFEIVPDVMDGRTGIVYEKINGNDLLHDVFSNMQNPEFVARKFITLASIHKDFISHNSEDCISYKDYLKYFEYPEADSLPDGNSLCHGDFHLGNLLLSQDASEKVWVIDFMNLCHGPKEYDVARSYVLITEDSFGPDIDAETRNFLLKAKADMGQLYLDQMGFSLKDIEQFIPAIEHCRKREMLS